jgi:hypothetical protein
MQRVNYGNRFNFYSQPDNAEVGNSGNNSTPIRPTARNRVTSMLSGFGTALPTRRPATPAVIPNQSNFAPWGYADPTAPVATSGPPPRVQNVWNSGLARYASPAPEPWVLMTDSPESIKQKSVARLLHHVHTIRLGIEWGGFRGSVSASMAALRELMHQTKDENVRFQVVCEKGTEEALAALLPNFDPSKPRQEINFNGKRMLFVREGNLGPQDRPSGLTIGFVGASHASVHPRQWLSIFGTSQAGGVSAMGMGQPYGYGGPQSILLADGRVKYLKGVRKGYPLRIPEYDPKALRTAIEKSVARDPRINDGGRERLTLARIFGELHYGTIDMMPIYGLHHLKTAGTQSDDLIRNICGGIHHAQHGGMPRKPVVLAVIGNHATELEVFDPNQWVSSDNPNHILFGNNAGTPDLLKNLAIAGGSDICLVYVGAVQVALFEQLFRLSTLPPIVEGANSANICQSLADKPYLHMDLSGTDFPPPLQPDLGHQSARNLSLGLMRNDFDSRHDVRGNYGRFILDSRDSESSVRRYFKAVHQDVESGNQVIDVLYPIAQELKFGPPEPPERTVRQQIETSPKTGIHYERHSDGKVFYRAPGYSGTRELVLSNLRPVGKEQKGFAKDHLVQPSDLQITKIVVPRPRFKQMFRPKENIQLEMLDPREARYVFEYDEFKELLILIGKNGWLLHQPQSYSRNRSDDDKTMDGPG